MMGIVQIRLAIVLVMVGIWELIAWSGWLYQEVFPSGLIVLTSVGQLVVDGAFYQHLMVTLVEIWLAGRHRLGCVNWAVIGCE